jgi:D-alanine-D-alanine ligase|uniref:ATP-grasp domain-containing protein n=1 Tax=Mesoaciditoga lauensis TaxID=1495039 RepID=A0A7V3RD97_9BACT
MGTRIRGEKIEREISKVVVLCGGTSPEREVSISSGKNIFNSLKNLKISSELFIWDGKLESLNFINDLCFISLHGSPGEDGSVQRYFESKGVIYTGSDSKSCELMMDKIKTKEHFKKIGVKTSDWSSKPEEFPCVFKPRFGGSSIGVKIFFSKDDLSLEAENGFFEKYLDGREITISILDTGSGPEILPILEIIPKGKFYDYDSKYLPDGSTLITPAPISLSEKKEIEEFSLKIYEEFNCKGFARIDGIISYEGIYFLEINAIPGMTLTSDLPASARAAGLCMDDVVKSILSSAMRR